MQSKHDEARRDVSPEERVQAYIDNVAQALEQIDVDKLGPGDQHIVNLAKAYLDDAKHYLEERHDVFTALACIAYAEGLLDALRWQGKINIQWQPLTKLLQRPKVLVAGTFDLIHPGHIELLRQAWLHGRVHVILARDKTVERMKGRPPIVPEQQRLEVIKAIRYVHKAVLGSTKDFLEPVLALKPDIILLGPDQWADEEWLKQQLAKHGLHPEIKRLPEKKQCPLCSSTLIACKARETIPPEACEQAKQGSTA